MTNHIPCRKCDSSDAATAYDDGLTHCFSCGTTYKTDGSSGPVIDTTTTDQLPVIGIHDRKISKQVAEHFDVRCAFDSDGYVSEHFYPYTKEGKPAGFKVRKLPKEFRTEGDFKGVELFGQSNCNGGLMLIVTEGELDAMSVAQSQLDTNGRIYDVVSLPSASGTNTLLAQLEFVRGYDKVILMLDNDAAGKEALDKAARIIGYDKTFIAKLPEKDPNETLMKHGSAAINTAIWNAKGYVPGGVVAGEEIWDAYQQRLKTVSIPYPSCMSGVNEKIKGMRMGEITLFTSGTGSGKSTLIKEIVLHLLQQEDVKVGMISLEESVGDTAEKFIGMQMRKNPNVYQNITPEEQRQAFDDVFGDERLVLLDHQGSVSDASLLDKIEFLALMGCKYLILDHITIAVSEGANGKSGNEAIDAVMSDLLKITKKHDVWLGVISHLRKTSGGQAFEEGTIASLDDIKGSGSIKQISFDVLAFARNMVAENPVERNTIQLSVLKTRNGITTGPAGAMLYDIDTMRLSYVEQVSENDFDPV